MLNLSKAKSAIDRQKTDIAREIVLLIDDEEPNLIALEGILSRKYRILKASSAAEALEILHTPGITVIVSDQRMPGMTGVQFFQEVEKRQHPATRIILTGYSELSSVVEGINSGHIFKYLTKPIVPEDLLHVLSEAVDHFNITQVNLRLLGMLKDLIEDNAQLAKRLGSRADAINQESGDDSISFQKPKKVSLAIMVIDIRGFTHLTNTMSAEKVIEILQMIYRPLHQIIYDSGGFVDKHMGDGVMAIFGLSGVQGTQAGIDCMRKIVKAYPAVSKSLGSLGVEALKIGIGLSAGEVVMGVLGTPARSELAVIGRPATLAYKLQEMTKIPLKDAARQKDFGSFDYAMGICLSNLVSGMDDFRKVPLSNEMKIAGFESEKEISVISN